MRERKRERERERERERGRERKRTGGERGYRQIDGDKDVDMKKPM